MTTHAAELAVCRCIVSTSSTSSTAVHGGFGIGLATVIVTVVLWCTMVNDESCNICKNDIIYVSFFVIGDEYDSIKIIIARMITMI